MNDFFSPLDTRPAHSRQFNAAWRYAARVTEMHSGAVLRTYANGKCPWVLPASVGWARRSRKLVVSPVIAGGLLIARAIGGARGVALQRFYDLAAGYGSVLNPAESRALAALTGRAGVAGAEDGARRFARALDAFLMDTART